MYQKNQSFDSIILAGGFGKRLSPLTDSLPKPMLPIAEVSALERIISLLREHNFKKSAVTTMYLAEKIESLTLENVEFIREAEPLGSAGAVGGLRERIGDYVIVISGDAYCDFDLTSAREEFLKSGCDAAILLCRREEIGEYGSVCVRDGRVFAFCEKPSVRDTVSNLISTGIYFLSKKAVEKIPVGKKYDFARDLFPEMLRTGMQIAAIEPSGHWFDIGTFAEYHRCNMWVSKGENCIGRQVSLHPSAKLEHCVIMDGCTIGNSVLRGCIVGEGAVIGNDCIIPYGCVIGPGAEIRDNGVLDAGTTVYTGETVIGLSIVDAFNCKKVPFEFDDDSLLANIKDDGFFVRLGRLLGGGAGIIAFAEGKDATLPQACELACGASESGSGCTVISGGNAAMASFAAQEYRSVTAFISSQNGKSEIRLFSGGGMPFSREEMRRLAERAPSGERKDAGSVYLLPHGALVKRYLHFLRDNIKLPKSISVGEGSENSSLREIADELAIKRGGNERFFLSDSGERAFVKTENGDYISYWTLLAICCIEGGRNGIILPNDTPETLFRILKRHSVDVGFYSDSESDMRRLAEGDRLHRDGILLALTAQRLAEDKGKTLLELAESIPPFAVVTRLIYADKSKMCSVVSALHEKCGGSRCAGFDFGDGRVNVYASASGRFRLIAEALDSETAEEITLRAIDKLNSGNE
ncbi:MAG: NTP transferase domain-containing protein [Clostridia bacterium]|nr:NTP transferase domain-containing protein [Clostridia bacterium]